MHRTDRPAEGRFEPGARKEKATASGASGLFAVIARGSLRWRWWVIGGWITTTVMAVLFLPTLNDVVHNDSTTFLPASSPSLRAAQLASPFIHQGAQSGVLVAVSHGGPIGPSDVHALKRLEAAIGQVPYVTGISQGGQSSDGRAVTAAVQFSSATTGGGATGSEVVAAVRHLMAVDTPAGVSTYLTGSLPILVDQQHAANHTEDNAGILSVLLILLVLAVAFRAVLGPLVALAPAGLALMLAGPLIAESTHLGVQISSLLELLLTALVLGAWGPTMDCSSCFASARTWDGV